jgi:hypothetical protein
MTVEDRSKAAKNDHACAHADGRDGSLASVRAVMILIVAVLVGLLAGTATAVPAGIAVAASAGPGWGILMGFITGLSAGTITSLTVAGGLHTLIAKA